MNIDIKNKKKWGLIALVIVMIVFVGINAKSIGQKFGVVPGGEISLGVPVSGSAVFMDDKQIQVTDTNNKTLNIKNVGTTGPHTIIVSKAGYWPWAKEVNVVEGKTLEIKAFNGFAGQMVEELTTTHPEYAKAVAALQKIPVATKKNMMISKSGIVGLWHDSKHVYAEWIPNGTPENFFCIKDACNRSQMVFRGTKPITSVSYYKDRDDVILFSTAGSIYAIEIDQNGTQNFQPVYEGTNAILVSSGANILYVKDGVKIMKVNL